MVKNIKDNFDLRKIEKNHIFLISIFKTRVRMLQLLGFGIEIFIKTYFKKQLRTMNDCVVVIFHFCTR